MCTRLLMIISSLGRKLGGGFCPETLSILYSFVLSESFEHSFSTSSVVGTTELCPFETSTQITACFDSVPCPLGLRKAEHALPVLSKVSEEFQSLPQTLGDVSISRGCSPGAALPGNPTEFPSGCPT